MSLTFSQAPPSGKVKRGIVWPKSALAINFSENTQKLEVRNYAQSRRSAPPNFFDSEKINENLLQFVRSIPEKLQSKPIYFMKLTLKW